MLARSITRFRARTRVRTTRSADTIDRVIPRDDEGRGVEEESSCCRLRSLEVRVLSVHRTRRASRYRLMGCVHREKGGALLPASHQNPSEDVRWKCHFARTRLYLRAAYRQFVERKLRRDGE